VAAAVGGQDGVLCALGAASPLRKDPSLLEGVRHIVRAMEEKSVHRLVYLSFLLILRLSADQLVFPRLFGVTPECRRQGSHGQNAPWRVRNHAPQHLAASSDARNRAWHPACSTVGDETSPASHGGPDHLEPRFGTVIGAAWGATVELGSGRGWSHEEA
jgi:hypothetical protein